MGVKENWLGIEGRNFVVTGAASGIGFSIAEAIFDVGANVVLLDANGEAVEEAARLLRERGGQALGLRCDTSSEADLAVAGTRVRREVGKVHGLINNAGILRAGNLDKVSIAEWQAVLSVNLTGYLLCARQFASDMLADGAGSIVNVASISGLHPQTGSGAYSASKAGVLLLSKQLAAEWGPRGVRSNAICPGLIRTTLSAKFYEQPGFERARAAATASRRIGDPSDIAQPALFLLSDRAAYVNGAELLVDGGLGCMLMDMVPRPGFNTISPAAVQKEAQ